MHPYFSRRRKHSGSQRGKKKASTKLPSLRDSTGNIRPELLHPVKLLSNSPPRDAPADGDGYAVASETAVGFPPTTSSSCPPDVPSTTRSTSASSSTRPPPSTTPATPTTASATTATTTTTTPTFPRRYFPSASKRSLPVIKFTPVSRQQYDATFESLKAAKRARTAVGGSVSTSVSRSGGAGLPFSKGRRRGLPGDSSRSHVKNCTCASCRSRAKAALSSDKTQLQLYYRTNSSSVLIHTTFRAHGFRPVRTKQHWNVFWTGSHLKSYVFQGLNRFQKINQFPRTYEVTRKDTLARNVKKMMEIHGERHFRFLPKSFVLPHDAAEFETQLRRGEKTPWIVKPAASAQGRGIYLSTFSHYTGVNMPDDVHTGERMSLGDSNATVSRYVANPLLIDGYKFDLRLYVAVTSFNPLRIYIHEEGLARFATERYSADPRHFKNRFIHLTNYSINKKSTKFVAGAEDGSTGHKWSLPALKARLREDDIDVDALWADIHDLLIKTFIAVEQQVVAAIDMFVPHPTNCFELFGVDVMIDDNLSSWLLEVNFAPSLACESPLDMRIKSEVISDLMNLAGFQFHDALAVEEQERHRRLARMPVSEPAPPPTLTLRGDMLLESATLGSSLRGRHHRDRHRDRDRTGRTPPVAASAAATDKPVTEEDDERETPTTTGITEDHSSTGSYTPPGSDEEEGEEGDNGGDGDGHGDGEDEDDDDDYADDSFDDASLDASGLKAAAAESEAPSCSTSPSASRRSSNQEDGGEGGVVTLVKEGQGVLATGVSNPDVGDPAPPVPSSAVDHVDVPAVTSVFSGGKFSSLSRPQLRPSARPASLSASASASASVSTSSHRRVSSEPVSVSTRPASGPTPTAATATATVVSESDRSHLYAERRKKLLSQATPDAAKAFRRSEEEHRRRGRFSRIYPVGNAHKYAQFFQERRPLNVAMADFEHQLSSVMSGGGGGAGSSTSAGAGAGAGSSTSAGAGSGAGAGAGTGVSVGLKGGGDTRGGARVSGLPPSVTVFTTPAPRPDVPPPVPATASSVTPHIDFSV